MKAKISGFLNFTTSLRSLLDSIYIYTKCLIFLFLGFAAIQPRLLLWNRRPDNTPQQPIIIVQPNQDSDRNRRPYWQDYYPFPPQRIPGLPDFGSNPSVIIVNPNNAQNLTFPAAAPAAARAAGGGFGFRNGYFRRESVPLIELLQGLNALEPESDANESDSAAALAAAPAVAQAPLAEYGVVEDDEEPNEDELTLLERQATRGLSTKNLLSHLMQDKKRRRFQEAVAGIYFRNYNQNRK